MKEKTFKGKTLREIADEHFDSYDFRHDYNIDERELIKNAFIEGIEYMLQFVTANQNIDDDMLTKYADEYEQSLADDYTWNEDYGDCDEGIHGVCSVCEIEKAYKAGYRKAKQI